MSHESSYQSVSGFSPKVRIRVGVGFRVRAGVRDKGWGYHCFFLKLNILTHESFTL